MLQARERERQVLELSKGGANFVQIADRLGISDRMVSRIYHRALERIPVPAAEEVRHLEVVRLDALLTAMWPKAMQGSGWAVERCLSIMERRARLLGLDAPTKHEVMTIDAIDAEIRHLEAELAGRAGTAPAEA